MSSAVKSASSKIDWGKIVTSLGLRGQTAQSLSGFKKRNDDARRRLLELREQSQEIDFGYYRSRLANQKVVNELEQAITNFKPQTYDVAKQIKTIEAFEVKAVENAKVTEQHVAATLKDLQETLSNIESAKPFEELTVYDFSKARPDIEEKTAELIAKGRWNLPGYKEKFGNLAFM